MYGHNLHYYTYHVWLLILHNMCSVMQVVCVLNLQCLQVLGVLD